MPSLPEIIKPHTKRAFLTFIKELDRVKKNGVVYRMALVKCDCGNIKEMQLHQFRREDVYSCGCRMYSKMTKNPFYKLEEKKAKEEKKELEERRKSVVAKDLTELSKMEMLAIDGKISIKLLNLETRRFNESTRR